MLDYKAVILAAKLRVFCFINGQAANLAFSCRKNAGLRFSGNHVTYCGRLKRLLDALGLDAG